MSDTHNKLQYGINYSHWKILDLVLDFSYIYFLTQISKETVFRKIHFIVAYAETIIKRFLKGVIYRPVLHLHAILVFCAV